MKIMMPHSCVRISSIRAVIEDQQNNECTDHRRQRVPSVASRKHQKAADKLPFSHLGKMYFLLHQTLAEAEEKTHCLPIFHSIINGRKHTEKLSFSV